MPSVRVEAPTMPKTDVCSAGRRSTLLVAIALAVAPAVLAQTLYTPAFVVPSFADLTIKKRQVFAATSSGVTTELLYLKGARERREFAFTRQSGDAPLGSASIWQCDQRRSVHLNLQAKLYTVSVLEDSSEWLSRRRALPERQGADVTTTFDTVDTGEQRRIGSYVARRVRTTITVDPSPGANTPASTRETDGWYIDLQGLGCSKAATTGYLAVGEVVRPGGLPDRHHYLTKGAARRGYAIEETNRSTQGGLTHVETVELIELSERAVEASLFEIPRDYQPALPLIRGGYDLTKPDTVANRIRDYWNGLTWLTHAIFQ
jgi:hypothetical protein